jgi:RNA-binding protein
MLTAKQRAFLKGLAHPLQPVVRLGKGKLSTQVLNEAERTLAAHELIKVRIELDESKERRSLAEALARKMGAELIGTIGKTAVLYRPFEEKPKIKLPV